MKKKEIMGKTKIYIGDKEVKSQIEFTDEINLVLQKLYIRKDIIYDITTYFKLIYKIYDEFLEQNRFKDENLLHMPDFDWYLIGGGADYLGRWDAIMIEPYIIYKEQSQKTQTEPELSWWQKIFGI